MMEHKLVTKRSSPMVRPSPLPFRWTGRDVKILSRCWEDKILTSHQLARLFFRGSAKRCNWRLRKLYSRRYLDRHFLPSPPLFRGAPHASYTLGRDGVQAVALELGLDPKYIASTRRNFDGRLASYSILLTLSHIQALADVRIAFEMALTESDATKLLGWIPERLLEQRFSANDDRLKLRPDGFVAYRDMATQKTYSAFIEVDMGTMSHKQIEAKVERYLAFCQTEIPAKEFGSRWFRVVFVTPSQRRSLQLMQTIAHMTDTMFWFTEKDKLVGDWLGEPIFIRVGADGRQPLIS